MEILRFAQDDSSHVVTGGRSEESPRDKSKLIKEDSFIDMIQDICIKISP